MRRLARRLWRPNRRAAWLLAAVAWLPLAGCSSYVTQGQQVRLLVEQGKHAEALKSLAELGGGSRLLGLYETGLVLQDQGRWAASDSVFDLAEQALDDLYTRSLSRDISAYLVNDATMEYRGDPFETAFLHYYRIVNFIERDDFEGAAVQARRLSHQLQLWRDAGKPFAGEGFFAYVAGLVFREAGARTDADVSFRNALDAYTKHGAAAGGDMPPDLLCDLAENAAALGDAAAAAEYRKQGGCNAPAKGCGRVVLLLESGYVPHKDAIEILLPIFKDEIQDDFDRIAFAHTLAGRRGIVYGNDVKLEYMLRLSLPRLAESPIAPARARMVAVAARDSSPAATKISWRPASAEDATAAAAVGAVTAGPAIDTSVFARAAFAEHEPDVLLRATVRGLTKYLAKRAADKDDKKGLGWAINLLGAATETADTRCWSLLPGAIAFARHELEPGSYRLVVDLVDRAGATQGTIQTPVVAVRPGRTTFVRYRTF
jgi:hypothetical protein